jgi:hypothetical protein
LKKQRFLNITMASRVAGGFRHGPCDDIDKKGHIVPKRDMTGCTMSITRVSRITANTAPMMRRAGDIAVTPPPGTALVPLAPATQAEPASLHLNRPDPSFVTHLIAMAEHSPQTRILRRAATADVEAAYRSVANQNETAYVTGLRMRLTA